MTTYVRCDTCHGEIRRPEEGQIEWLVRRSGDDQIGRGLRVVHVNSCSPQAVDGWGCQYDLRAEYRRDGSRVYGSAITDFLGSVGLARLLDLLESAVLPQQEVIALIWRLHVDCG